MEPLRTRSLDLSMRVLMMCFCQAMDFTHQLSQQGLQASPQMLSASRRSAQSCFPVTAIPCTSEDCHSAARAPGMPMPRHPAWRYLLTVQHPICLECHWGVPITGMLRGPEQQPVASVSFSMSSR